MGVRARSVGTVGAFLLALSVFSASAKDPEWIEGHSAHFHVISNAGDKKSSKVTVRMEEFRHLLTVMLPRLRYDPPVPTTVVLFANDKSFRPYKPLTPEGRPKDIAGLFQPGHEAMFLMMDTSDPRAEHIAYHEYVHLVMHLNFGVSPLWLEEGMATFYESTEIDGARNKVGFPQIDYYQHLRRNSLIPLDVLLTVGHDSPYYNDSAKQQLFYGESWLLVHYLMTADKGSHRAEFANLIDLLRSGMPPAAAFQQALGMDLKTTEKKLEGYLHQFVLGYSTVTLTEAPPKFDATFAPMDQDLAKTYLADLWISQGRVALAEKALKPLAGGGSPDILYRLGRIALERGDYAAAEENFRTALAARPDDIGLRYHAAVAVVQATWSPGSSQEEMRQSAARVIDYLAPVADKQTDFPDALDLLVQARMMRGDPPEVMIPLLEQVRQAQPQRHDLGLMLANSYLQAQRWDEAETLLKNLSGAGLRADQQKLVDAWLDQVARMRAYQQRQEGGPIVLVPGTPAAEGNGSGPAIPQVTRLTEPVEPAAPAAPVEPPKISYVRGVLVTVECNGDAAVVAVREETKKGPGRTLHFKVRSRKDVILIGAAEDQTELACGDSGARVGINYVVQPEGPSLAGSVVTIEFRPPEL